MALAAVAATAIVVVSVTCWGLLRTGEASNPIASERSVEEVVASNPLEEPFEACDADDVTEVLAIADGGSTVLIDTRTEYGATQPVVCMFAMLGTSSGLQARISSTTSLMGAQEGSEDGFTYTWSYHPDNGLDMVITSD